MLNREKTLALNNAYDELGYAALGTSVATFAYSSAATGFHFNGNPFNTAGALHALRAMDPMAPQMASWGVSSLVGGVIGASHKLFTNPSEIISGAKEGAKTGWDQSGPTGQWVSIAGTLVVVGSMNPWMAAFILAGAIYSLSSYLRRWRTADSKVQALVEAAQQYKPPVFTPLAQYQSDWEEFRT